MKQRAPSDQVARIKRSDLVKYFDMRIGKAARHLNFGLTVLKRKCRQFGIPRCPHQKIKSLDGLINDIQEEAGYQELEENKDAAMAVTERQKIPEREKENMERKPYIDIEKDTKKFRQGLFKRKHEARVLQKRGSAISIT